ncbi:unnamed protein product, partial [Choristocarpus tenellus]
MSSKLKKLMFSFFLLYFSSGLLWPYSPSPCCSLAMCDKSNNFPEKIDKC